MCPVSVDFADTVLEEILFSLTCTCLKNDSPGFPKCFMTEGHHFYESRIEEQAMVTGYSKSIAIMKLPRT